MTDKAFKAKRMRYKKPIARDLNYETIVDELWDMTEECENVKWYESDESLIAALDGDEDEAYEFKIAFSDLCAELEQFRADLTEGYVSEYFDTLFPAAKADCFGGYLGWDDYEGDYFGLEPYEYAYAENEAAKKITRLTKKELLEAVGQCMKILKSYIGIRYRYDCLKSAMDIIKGSNMERIQLTKAINEQYLLAEESSEGFANWNKDVWDFDKIIENVPREYWIQ